MLFILYHMDDKITASEKLLSEEQEKKKHLEEQLIEKDKSLLEKLKEENKTHLEKLAKEWQVKYIQDIEELKKLFKDSEKIIRTKSVSSSRRSLVGKFIERFIPFLKKLPYEPSDMHFLGQPVDYIVFQGLHEDKIDKVIFVEVKTGQSKLTKREKSLKETIERKRVGWKEINIDTADDNLPDKDMTNEDTSINDLYKTIEQKVSSVKNKTPNLIEYKTDDEDEDGEEEDEETTDFICPECRKIITLELDEEDNLDDGIETDCPYCKKEITLYEDDLEENQE